MDKLIQKGRISPGRAVLLIAVLLALILSGGCIMKREVKVADENSWEDEVLWANECGMDGLKCCEENDPPCFYGQSCCSDPADPNRRICLPDCGCGLEDGFCCTDEPNCESGLACVNGYCLACGLEDQPCCSGQSRCAEGLVCGNGKCVECGLPGNPCCQGGSQCAGEERHDQARTDCIDGKCIFCGTNGRIKCDSDPPCETEHLLNNDFCYACGLENKPCCDTGTGARYECDPDANLACELGFCTSKF